MLVLSTEDKGFSSLSQAIYDKMIEKGSIWWHLRHEVAPLLPDEMFSEMYSLDNGRPAISPSMLAIATIIQMHERLSDRRMEEAARYDVRVKYALGLEVDEWGFDYSALNEFRERLLRHGKSKESFEEIVKHLVGKGMIKKGSIQRIDTVHIIADIAIVNTIDLIRGGIKGLIGGLERGGVEWTEEIERLKRRYIDKEEVEEEEGIGKGTKEKRLVEVVNEARQLLRWVREEGIEGEKIREAVEVLERVLRENITEKGGSEEEIVEKEKKDKPKDRIVSVVDTDARGGAKSKKKKFTGYKASTTEEVENNFITNIEVDKGNITDDKPAVGMVEEQKKNSIEPEKLIGDKAYGTGENRSKLKEMGTRLVSPPKEKANPTGLYTINEFDYDEDNQRVGCPAGEETDKYTQDKKTGNKIFHFPGEVCSKCSLKEECTKSEQGRTITISRYYNELKEAEGYAKTQQYKEDMKLRPPIEAKQAEMVRWHGLRRARYRGLPKVRLQAYFTALAVNIKRWVKLLTVAPPEGVSVPA